MVSLANARTHGLPILNGNPKFNTLSYPASGIPDLPCTFLGSTIGHGEMCFFFASGAIPAQDNYELAMSERDIQMSAIVAAPASRSNSPGYRARLSNARQASTVWFSLYSTAIGLDASTLKQCQIITYGRWENVATHITWTSRMLD